MSLFLLLTAALTTSYFSPRRAADAQMFMIRDVTLSIEPGGDVTRDTNVTLRCRAAVSSSGPEVLTREYTIYKDGTAIYTKTSRGAEDLLYRLDEARVANTGRYACKVAIEGRPATSGTKKLTVTGLSEPVLRLNKGVVSEGEELTATCTAPGEAGSIFFYFYEDGAEIREQQVGSDRAEVTLRLGGVGVRRLHCAYTVLVSPHAFKSTESNGVTVSVKELPIAVVLEILPRTPKIYEGDELFVSCSVQNALHAFDSVHLYLSQGDKLLSRGHARVNHSGVALAEEPADFECRLETGDVVKLDKKTISVTELFSAPTLSMSPAEVFQKEQVRLTCRSESSAPERLDGEELVYTLDPPGGPLAPRGPGVFSGYALPYDFNYTCAARVKGIVKHSAALSVRPKVSVSTPKISMVGRAVLGRPFQILCRSDVGSLPVNYTLLTGYDPLSTVTVERPPRQALFTATVHKPEDIGKFMCEAQNRQREAPLSKRLNATVIVPLTHPLLTVIPHLADISEGDDLYLICGVRGSPPVSFKWYRVGERQPLYTTTSGQNHTDYRLPGLSRGHSGVYYCEAVNHADNVVRSDSVTIEVRLALWKKALAGGFSLLALCVLLVVCVLCFRSKRGNREAAAELSVEGGRSGGQRVERATARSSVCVTECILSAARDEESSVVSNEPDVEYTEVVHPRPVDPNRAGLLRKGPDTVYSELQSAPHGAADHLDYGSVEYAELSREQAEVNHQRPEVNHQRPEVNHHHPEVNHNRLEVNHHRPEVNHHRPEVNHHHPEVNHNRPEVNHNRPEVNHHRPEVNHHHPEVNHNRPEVNHHRPEVNHHRPEVNHTRPEVNHHQDLPVPVD
ncbi:platelet endothelial cell adhesion molecule isoform X3 [Pseudoliparis swirei]|uniref:platelet endothelial cell adhesion molecule isoform X3 n=1 Tax=Pseudoliparis swirei TaxID=2059687 RepID=UPI0024BEED60|nr:platelet endothelial cell adhesion molecule isoform X3 [Pseudoliparis swirei]